MTPLSEFSDSLRYWMPLLTVATLVVKAYRSSKNKIESWAHLLLENHLAHLQGSLTRIEGLLEKLVEKS